MYKGPGDITLADIPSGGDGKVQNDVTVGIAEPKAMAEAGESSVTTMPPATVNRLISMAALSAVTFSMAATSPITRIPFLPYSGA